MQFDTACQSLFWLYFRERFTLATFDFNPLAESVAVTYKCPHCGQENIETFLVPSPNYAAETHHDSENQEFFDTQCRNYESEFNVIITNGYYGGSGEVEDVDEIIDVEESILGEDDEYYDKLLFKETHSDTEKALEAIEGLPQDINDNLYRLLYANNVSKLEAFLCDTIVSYVLESNEHKKRFVQNYEPLATQKFQMSAIYAKYQGLDKIINGTLVSIVYHDIELVRKLYRKTADIDLPDTKEIEEAIQIRYHIIHRNGKVKEENIINIKQEDVESLSNLVSDFIYDVDSLIAGKKLSEALPDTDDLWK